MKITKWTKTKDVLPLLNEKNIQSLIDKIPPYPYKSVLSMQISEFGELVEDEYAYITKNIFMKHKRFLKAFGMMKDLRSQMENLGKFIEKFNRKQTPEEKQAARGIMFPSFIQRILLDVVKFFGLKNFEEAEKMKVCDWLLIFQNESANNLYQTNYQKILEQKSKQKTGKHGVR